MNFRKPVLLKFPIITLSIIVFVFSCTKEHKAIPKKVFEGEISKELPQAIIDTSDLYYLPRDTGGQQIGYPLGKTKAVFGHFIYTPGGYEKDTSNYPLIVFMHGYGERGDSRTDASILNRVKTWGPTRLIEAGKWDPSYPFIVASPQLVTEYWAPNEVHEFIEYLLKKYRINKRRIYITGLSQGGGGSWYYAGQREDHYAAAIVPISGRGEESLIKNLKKVPIWAFHGETDNLVDPFKNYGSVTMVEAINAHNPTTPAKVTLYLSNGHNAWTRTYENQFAATGISYNSFNMNIFDWMLQYKKEE